MTPPCQPLRQATSSLWSRSSVTRRLTFAKPSRWTSLASHQRLIASGSAWSATGPAGPGGREAPACRCPTWPARTEVGNRYIAGDPQRVVALGVHDAGDKCVAHDYQLAVYTSAMQHACPRASRTRRSSTAGHAHVRFTAFFLLTRLAGQAPTPHTWTNGLGLMANLHLVAGVGGGPYVEFSVPEAERS